jgi:hypothetical protein
VAPPPSHPRYERPVIQSASREEFRSGSEQRDRKRETDGPRGAGRDPHPPSGDNGGPDRHPDARKHAEEGETDRLEGERRFGAAVAKGVALAFLPHEGKVLLGCPGRSMTRRGPVRRAAEIR